MAIRLGKIEDMIVIMNVIKEATINMEANRLHQWDDIYPSEEIILNDINENNLYVSVNESGMVHGIIVLNEHQDKEYGAIKWEHNTGSQLVIHRLCVHPNFQGKGVARTLINFAEDIAAIGKYEALRLDAFILNTKACKMYEHSGYESRGIVTFRKGDFYCYEKVISRGK